MDETIINMDELTADEQIAILRKLAEPQPIKIDGTLKLIDEVRQYLNNWQAATKNGYQLRSRQVRETISIFQNTLIDPEIFEHLSKSDIDLTNRYIKVLEQLSDRLNIRLEKYADLPEQPQKPAKKRTEPITFQWQNKPDEELPELHSLMINKYKLIAPDTTFEQFEPIFTGKPVESISPIKWHDDNASELLYFIDRLEQTDQIKHTKNADYIKMTACFVKPNGDIFQAQFKSLKTNIQTNLSPDKQKAIDELVNNF